MLFPKRELFLAQAPIPLVAGIAALFVIPKTADTVDETEPMSHRLAKIDYLGVITLVCWLRTGCHTY